MPRHFGHCASCAPLSLRSISLSLRFPALHAKVRPTPSASSGFPQYKAGSARSHHAQPDLAGDLDCRRHDLAGDTGGEVGGAVVIEIRDNVIASASEAIHESTRRRCWIASSLTLLAMTGRNLDRHTRKCLLSLRPWA